MAVVPKAERGSLDITVQVRMDAALIRRIDAVVEETGRKRSDVIRLLVLSALEQHEKERSKK